MPDTNNPANKYTLKEWVKHPTTIMLAIAVNLIWVLVVVIINMGKDSGTDRIKDLSEQVVYLRERIDKLEEMQDKYTTTILFKDGQIKTRDKVIDSLTTELTNMKTQGGLK